MSTLVRSAQRVVAALPDEVFEILVCPARHGEFDGSGTLRGLVQGPERLALGDRFRMTMHLGIGYCTDNTVVVLEPGQAIAWRTAAERDGRTIIGGQVWRYDLTDLGDGRTLVRETYDLSGAKGKRLVAKAFGLRTQNNMSASLDRLAEIFDAR